ncbi:MAG: hypothetical protein IKV97_03870 [Clostridia bacterium]|nr:hypothetical protein [Clostridia bacterium]
MSIYYVSANGCDTNDGLSPEKAWQSISKVNATIVGGDEVRFRCGDTFYGRIYPKAGISSEQPTTYTSYGEGKKPVVSQYKIPHAGVWEKVSDNIYMLDMNDISKFDGNRSEIDANAGFIKVSGVIKYRKVFGLDELTSQWDFYTDMDKNLLYVYSEKAPDEISDDIKIACNINCIPFTTHLKVCGIAFIGTGGHGINGVTGGAYISDCEFHEIGGSRLPGYPDPRTRYGNGVECWSNSHDVTVERCKFSDVYDVAITMQGTEVKVNWENMYFRDNEMWNCTQCFEIWSSGKLPDTGFVNCYFENNTCVNSGICWGNAARPNKEVSTHLLIYHLECPLCDITIRNNFFGFAKSGTLYKHLGIKAVPHDYKIYGNTILRPAGQLICNRADATDEEVAAFEKKIAETNLVIDNIDYLS